MRELVNNAGEDGLRLAHVGRYALGQPIASGGMATLHLGRLVGAEGFARTVAIKRLHPHLCVDPSFVEMFAAEARLAARIRHPNVVPTLDVVRADGELLLVMEYVDGESLSALSRQTLATVGRIPLPIAVAIVSEMLHGLHSAHEAKSESGEPLEMVHRDVSPQNVLVGADGVARLVDFGIAKATRGRRANTTGEGDLKGKLAYMAPEQIRRERVTRQTDIFAAGVILWELLTGTRLFASDNEGATLEKILVGWVAPPSSIVRDLPPRFDEIALRALDAEPNNRFETAREMAVALEDAAHRALGREVAAWVEATAGSELAARRSLVSSAERTAGAAAHTLASRGVRGFESSVTTEMVRGVVAIEPERTVTAFSAEGMLDPTVELSGSIPPALVVRPRGGIADRMAVLIFALAATVTVFFGARYAGVGSSLGSSTSSPSAATVEVTPTVAATPAEPATVTTLTTLTTTATPTPTPIAVIATAAATVASPPAPRRAARPRSPPPPAAAIRAPCVAKLDPTTGKKVYQGDCD